MVMVMVMNGEDHCNIDNDVNNNNNNSKNDNNNMTTTMTTMHTIVRVTSLQYLPPIEINGTSFEKPCGEITSASRNGSSSRARPCYSPTKAAASSLESGLRSARPREGGPEGSAARARGSSEGRTAQTNRETARVGG